MNWDDLQKEARDAGYLIFAMDQSQTAIMRQPGPWGNAYSGYCAGCATLWIGLRYGGSDFAFDPKTKVLEMPDWRVTRDQNVYEDTSGSQDTLSGTLARFGPAFAQYGLTFNAGNSVMRTGAPDAGKFASAGAKAEGCYFIDMRRSGGGHAIAMQNLGSGGWRLFDANYGEFEIRSANFDAFMAWYLYKTGYGTRYTLSTAFLHVNPPPAVLSGFEGMVKALIKRFGG